MILFHPQHPRRNPRPNLKHSIPSQETKSKITSFIGYQAPNPKHRPHCKTAAKIAIKTLNIINPTRDYLKHSALAVAAGVVLAAPASAAPPVSSGLIVSLSADSVNTQDLGQVRIDGADTYVKRWNDQTSNGHNATQITEEDQPKYIASGSNSMPVLRFAQRNDDDGSRLYLGDLSSSTPTAASIYIVSTIDNDGRYNRVLTTNEANQVGGYLAEKYGLTTSYPPAGPPAAPTGLVATPLHLGVRLDWTASASFGITGYNVYRGTATTPSTESETPPTLENQSLESPRHPRISPDIASTCELPSCTLPWPSRWLRRLLLPF